MKNIFLVLLCVFVLSGCSKDDEKNNSKNSVLVKMIEDEDYTHSYTYNGNKINEIIQLGGGKTLYTYNGDFIVKEQGFEKEGGDSSSFMQEYFYENNKLKTRYSTDGNGTSAYIQKNSYTYNTDGTISYNIYEVDAETKTETLINSGVYTFSKGNIMKNENSKKIRIFEYDDKNNPFKNVIGTNKLFGESLGQNNVLKETIIDKVSGTSNVRSYEYDYNPDGYPIVQRYFFDGKPDGSLKYSY